jgi:DNA repair exonuclease SbcCD nuclease subunit
MRIVFATDSHAKAKSPEKRMDIYSIAILRKFLELVKVGNKINADIILHGGDMFDLPRVTPDYVGQLAEILKTSIAPIYVVPGNHDVFGHTASTINQTMLGLLNKTGVINILNRDNPLTLYDDKYGFDVSIQGQEYYQNIDQGNTNDYNVKLDMTSAYHILAVHGMLVDKPFIPGVHHTVISDVKSDADIVLAGHYHPGWNTTKQGKTTFINPGSMARVAASIDNDRMPQYVVLEITDQGIKYVLRDFKTADDPKKVLDFSSKLKNKITKNNIQNFKSALQNTNVIQSNDILKILQDIEKDSTNNVDQQMVSDSLSVLATVQKSKDDAVPKLDGYLPSKNRVYITKIEAENFMSYKNLDLDLDPGLNTIRGESNTGKTSILRLIKWVQYGEPRGSDFISHWGKQVTGRITYSNGYTIERSRTRTSSGGVKIIDSNGAIVGDFKGTKDNPVDILNICQIPHIWITKDEKRNVAIADQLETSFLVTESPGFKASAIGRLTGLQDVDAAVRFLSTENKSINKTIKIHEKILKTDTNDLLKYKELNKKQNKIKKLEQLISTADSIKNEIDGLKRLQVLINGNRKQRIDTINLINSLNKLPPQSSFDDLEKISKDITELKSIKNSLNNIKIKYNNTQNELNLLKTIPKMEQHFKKLEAIVNNIFVLTKINNKVLKNNTELLNTKNNIKKTEKEIEKIDKELDKTLGSESCLCPVCNQVIKKEVLLGEKSGV